MKKGLLFSLGIPLFFSALALTSCGKNKNYDIISTSFAGYDFARAVAGDEMSTGMLLNPGEELHEYSPSIGDRESILNSKVFIYIGGESDKEWVEKQILPKIDKEKTKVISMMDVILNNNGSSYYEEEPLPDIASSSEEEEESEYDEHIWNSISNAKLIVNYIDLVLEEIDSSKKETYKTNSKNYIEKLDEVDNNIKGVLNEASKNLLVFADRFPLLYFVREYNLDYVAAFKGCDTSKDAAPTTIEVLTNKVLDNDIKVIFVIELSEAKVANPIKKNVNNQGKELEIRTFYTMHNVSEDDFKKGTTYIDFMNKNIESLRIALN